MVLGSSCSRPALCPRDGQSTAAAGRDTGLVMLCWRLPKGMARDTDPGAGADVPRAALWDVGAGESWLFAHWHHLTHWNNVQGLGVLSQPLSKPVLAELSDGNHEAQGKQSLTRRSVRITGMVLRGICCVGGLVKAFKGLCACLFTLLQKGKEKIMRSKLKTTLG